jgi:UBX domain-containing protein 1
VASKFKLGETFFAYQYRRAPLDLLGVRLNQRVTMRVQKRLSENYIPPPKPPSRPFGGTGNRLGSPLPANMVRAAEPSSQAAQIVTTQTSAQPSMIFEVDNSLPVTSVQIRLSDGSRMVTRFNHTHTVGDIRRHIAL